MENNDIKVRVIKGNWRTGEVYYLSEPMTVAEALEKEKELVATLAPRGSGETKLVKFYEDKGPNFDYMSVGGWFIYCYKERTLF